MDLDAGNLGLGDRRLIITSRVIKSILHTSGDECESWSEIVLMDNQGHYQEAERSLCYECFVSDKMCCFGKLIDYCNFFEGGRHFVLIS